MQFHYEYLFAKNKKKSWLKTYCNICGTAIVWVNDDNSQDNFLQELNRHKNNSKTCIREQKLKKLGI